MQMEKQILEILTKHANILEQHGKTLEEHTKILNEHTKILNEHTEILQDYSRRLESLERSVLIIEDYVTNRIPALFDGYSMHQQKQEEFDDAIEKLDNRTTIHSIKISALEDITRKNSKKSAKLSS